MHIFAGELGHHWSRYWLVACWFGRQAIVCTNTVNGTQKNKFQSKCNNFIQEYEFENVIYQIVFDQSAMLTSYRVWD